MNVFIPIKKHSSRVPGKNFRMFASGVPLWRHTVERLLREVDIETLLIDADCDEAFIKEANSLDPRVQCYSRLQQNKGDDVSVDVLIHRAAIMLQRKYAFQPTKLDSIKLLQMHVTSPLWTKQTLERVYAGATEEHSAMTVTRLHQRIWRMLPTFNILPVNHHPAKLIPTQNLEPFYVENSVAYAIHVDGYFAHGCNRVYGEPRIVECHGFETVDIDTEDDWQLANKIWSTKGDVDVSLQHAVAADTISGSN